MAETFIFRKEWIENIDMLDISTQDKILSDLARYGAGVPLQHENDPVVASIVESQKKRIDVSIDAYSEKVVMSKSAGRKATVDRTRIYELACNGMSAKEIAAIIGCSQSTVQHSEEWKRARQNLKSIPKPKEKSDEPKKFSVFDF